jgi:hypothetical protein
MNVGRVTGFNAVVLYYNYAWNGMTVLQNTSTPKPSIGDVTNSIDGKGITADEAKTQGTWTTAGFSFGSSAASPWVWNGTTATPSLYFEAAGRVWPAHLN